jgi:hypothetical protein
MIYPSAFQQPVIRAFASALDGKDFGGKPVLPAIQTYGNIGAASVAEQIIEVRRRGLPGYQAYTIAHATGEEWRIIINDAPQVEEEDMAAIETLRRTNAVAALFLQAAGFALRGEVLPRELHAQLRFLLSGG